MPAHAVRHNTKILKRVFGGLPVVDSKRELRVVIRNSDISRANRRDPSNCVLAKACRRLFGSHHVAFFRTIAYADLPDEKGHRRIERFVLPRSTRSSIVRFDKTGKADPAGYHLLPPSPGCTMDRRLAVERERNADKTSLRSAPRRKIAKKKIIAEVRSGKGIVQFLHTTKDWTRYAKVAVNK